MLNEKRRIASPPMDAGLPEVARLVDEYFNAYNAARLREACQLFTRLLDEDALVGVSLSGALTPAGLSAVLVPMLRDGLIDYVSSTGANLYHDLQFDRGGHIYKGSAEIASGRYDVQFRKDGIIRIYDLVFPIEDLFRTDEWLYRVLMQPEFHDRTMGTSELHNRVGRFALETARQSGVRPSLLATAYEHDLPVFCPSPGDSTLGMNVAALWASRRHPSPRIEPSIDVTQMAAIVLDAKRAGRPSATIMFGGGAPKNFLLQTEPQIQEVLGIEERGHDYFLQFTDARPDHGGLSGATPNEAVSWGKIDPDRLPDCVTCYVDSTVAMPILVAYARARARRERQPRRLYRRLDEMVARLQDEYSKSKVFQRYYPQPEHKKLG